MKISTAVIAVAGSGTRFLPATKTLPKELFPILDKPVVQYLVEEAVASGIKNVVLVTRPGAHDIAEHFSDSPDLEALLARQGKSDLLVAVRSLSQLANIAVVRQGRHLPYGNATPLLAAKAFLPKDEAFVYMFGDDLVLASVPCIRQLVELYDKHQPDGIVTVQEIPWGETHRYGVIETKPGPTPLELASIVEKPPREQAPSNLAQLGRFILPPRILGIIDSLEVGKAGELWLTDAIQKLGADSRVLVHVVDGVWYTTGDPLRFLIASIEYGLRSPAIAPDLKRYLKELRLPSE